MNISNTNKTGLKLLMLNAFIYITLSFYTPFLGAYYTKAGMKAIQVGILLTIAPVLSIFIQPLWAIISDRTGRKKDILSLVVLGSALSMFSYYIDKSFLSFFIASFLLAIFSTSVAPLSDALVLKIAKKNHLDFSKIRLGGTIGYAIFVIIAGSIVKQNPPLQFVLGFAGYMILLIIVRMLPKEENEDRRSSPEIIKSKPTKKSIIGILHIFESKQIYFILIIAFISQVGLNMNYSYLGVYMTDLGLSENKIALINCIAALSEIPILILINRILKKVNTMRLLFFSCLLLAFRLFMITGGNIIYFIISQAFHGLSFMTIYYSSAVFISNHVKQENQSQGQSVLAIIQMGIGAIVGNIAGGLLVDYFGLKNAYQIMSFIIFIVTALTALIYVVITKKKAINEQ